MKKPSEEGLVLEEQKPDDDTGIDDGSEKHHQKQTPHVSLLEVK